MSPLAVSRPTPLAVALLLALAAVTSAQLTPPQPPLLTLNAPVDALDSAGDLDGDGHADLVASSGGQGVRAFSGQTGELLWDVVSSGQFGFAKVVDGGMDRDGDGIPDILFGAPSLVNGSAGVLSGGDGSTAIDIAPVGVGWSFGESLAWLGDVDGDGVPDAAIGDPLGPFLGPGPQPRNGMVHVFSGATFKKLYARMGATGDQLGESVATIGDVDLDGFPDFVAGASQFQSSGAGYVRLYSGDSGVLLRSWDSEDFETPLGRVVAGIGDVNADGLPDVALGAPFINRVFVASAADGAILHELTSPEPTLANFGGHVAGVGDIDGDNVPDLSVSARGVYPMHDAAFVLSVADGEPIAAYSYPHGANNEALLLLVAASDGGGSGGDGTGNLALGIPAMRGILVLGRGGSFWEDLGAGLAGRAGTPTLTATGVIAGDQPIELAVRDAAPFAPAMLVIGSPLPQPLLGGTLVPSPDILLAPLMTDALGNLGVQGRWPPLPLFQVPFGTEYAFQSWIWDATGPSGFTASNAVSSHKQ